MVKILVSGFKPFLGSSVNSSQKIVEMLVGESLSKVILPVEFEKSFLILDGIIKNEKPNFVLMLGQASDRKKISLEKIALNWNESIHPDEVGFFTPIGPIDKNNPHLALMTKFPVNLLHDLLISKMNHVEISFSAGAYVCNNLYFNFLKNYEDIPALFVHIPLIETLALNIQIDIVQEIIEFIKKN